MQTAFGLGMKSAVASDVMKTGRVGEFLIHSTFKTNKQRLELFARNGMCHGTGFPLVYLFGQVWHSWWIKHLEKNHLHTFK